MDKRFFFLFFLHLLQRAFYGELGERKNAKSLPSEFLCEKVNKSNATMSEGESVVYA